MLFGKLHGCAREGTSREETRIDSKLAFTLRRKLNSKDEARKENLIRLCVFVKKGFKINTEFLERHSFVTVRLTLSITYFRFMYKL